MQQAFAELINRANHYQEANELQLATEYYLLAAEQQQSASLYYNLANCYKRQHKLDLAEHYWQRCLSLDEHHQHALYNLATIYAQQQQWQQAIGMFQQLLQYHPAYHSGKYNLALCYRETRNFADLAIILPELILTTEYNLVAHILLAELYFNQQQLHLANFHVDTALMLAPQNEHAIYLRANIMQQLQQYKTSNDYWQQLTTTNNYKIDSYLQLGSNCYKQNLLAQAKNYYLLCLQQEPKHFAALYNLGSLAQKAANYSEALQYYQEACAVEPNNEQVQYLIASLTAQNNFTATPPSIINTIFNDYANSFEQDMQTLHYTVPNRIKDILVQHANIAPAGTLLDLGCGTGLMAAVLKQLFTIIIGVDLAANMLSIAQQKQIYTALYQAEVHAILPKLQNVHVVTAADLCCYIGNLKKLFKLIHDSLAPNGYFIFSVEDLTTVEQHNYLLTNNCRFQHQTQYIVALSKALPYKIIHHHSTTLRYNHGIPVAGSIFLLQKM